MKHRSSSGTAQHAATIMSRHGYLLAVCFILLLSACSSPAGNTPDPTPTLSRIEITPGTLLLTQADDTATLAAQAFDEDGNPIEATFVWTSSDDSVVSVDASGQLTSNTALGSAQITARAEGISSPPMMVSVAQPAADAVVLQDEEVLSAPTFTLDTFPSVGDQYTVDLANASSLEPGDVVLGTGNQPVAGRVVDVDGSAVVLEVLPATDLFDELSIEERFEVNSEDLILPQANNGQLRLEPDGSIMMTATVTDRDMTQSDDGKIEFDLGLLKCVAEAPIPLSGSQVELKIDPKLEYQFATVIKDGQTERILRHLTGSLTVTVSAGLSLGVALQAKVVCRQLPIHYVVPVGGPIAYLAGAQIPFGIGMDLEGKFELSKLELKAEAQLVVSVSVGLDYNINADPSYQNLSTMNATGKLDTKITSPFTTDNVRVQGGFYIYAYTGIDLGSKALNYFGLKVTKSLLAATAGLRQDVNLATPFAQVRDRNYAANYDLKLQARVGPGDDLAKLFLIFEDVPELKLANFTVTADAILSQSPVGTLRASRDQLEPGESIVFTVELDPTFINYLGAYNVDSIAFYSDEDDRLELLHSIAASPEQTRFVWDWQPTEEDTGDYTIIAFVNTEWLPTVSLEINSKEDDSSVDILVDDKPEQNQAPSVNAGSDQTTSVDSPLVLSGTVTDDGLPDPPASVEVLWSKQAGPGTVSFSNASDAVTEVSFSEAGSYVLNLSADDGELTASDQLSVEVLPAAPTITEFTYVEDDNGDGVLEVDEFAFFAATASGGVFGPYSWTVTPTPVDEEQIDPSEPGDEGALGFATAFGTIGSHEVCIEVADIASQSSGVSCLSVTVEDKNASNQAPEVTVNSDQTIKLADSASLSATVSDDGLPDPPASVTTSWTQSSGPSTATIADPSVLTTSVSFPQVGSYTFEFSASDGALTTTASTTVTVENDLTISSFSATPNQGHRPLEVTFNWSITGLVGDENCTLTTGDGAILPVSCNAGTSTHRYERLGSFTALLRVEPSDSDPISREAAVLVEPRSLTIDEGFSLVQADDGCRFSASPFTTGDIQLVLNETEDGNAITIDLTGSGSGTRNIVCNSALPGQVARGDLTWQQNYTATATGGFSLEGELASFTITGTLQGSGSGTWSNCRDPDDEPVSCPSNSGGGYQFPVTFQGVADFSDGLSTGDIIVGDIGLPTQGSW